MPVANSFKTVLKQLKNIPTPRKIIADGIPEMIADGVEIRADVFTTIWYDMKKSLKKV